MFSQKVNIPIILAWKDKFGLNKQGKLFGMP